MTNSKDNFNDITFFVSDSPLVILPDKSRSQLAIWLKIMNLISQRTRMLYSSPIITILWKAYPLKRLSFIVERVGEKLMVG